MLAQEIHNLGFMVVGWTGEGVVDVRKQFTKGLVYLNDTVVLIPAQNSTEDYADEPFLKLRSQTQDCLLLLAYHKNGAIAPYVLISMAGNVGLSDSRIIDYSSPQALIKSVEVNLTSILKIFSVVSLLSLKKLFFA